MSQVKWTEQALSTPIDKNATLADGARAAGDYDNSTKDALFVNAYLRVQYDAGPPTAGDFVGILWALPGDGQTTEQFPEGGDGTVGQDDDPQGIFEVGRFQTVNPSTTVDEDLCIPRIAVGEDTTRFVFKNTSGQTMDSTWQLDVVPYKAEIV